MFYHHRPYQLCDRYTTSTITSVVGLYLDHKVVAPVSAMLIAYE